MTSTRYLLIVLRATLFLCWASTGAAATIVLGQSQPYVLDPVLAMLSCVISTLSGASALAIRVNTLLLADPNKPMTRPWLFAVAHMLGSWLAGLVAFLSGRINHWDTDNVMLTVLVLSFGGAKVVELLVEKFLPVIRVSKE